MLVPLVLVALVALVHLLAGHLRRLSHAPRSRWLSFAGGVPVAFVFLELLPSLASTERAVAGEEESLLRYVPYIVALGGLALFYGVERIVKGARDSDEDAPRGADGAFWASMASFSLLNVVAGYLLVEEERHVMGSVLFALALALKFLVVDRALYEDHRRTYERVGRWIVVGAFVGGALVAVAGSVPEAWFGSFHAFLTGAILLNVIKEELPAERKARWGAFAFGAIAYAALFLGAQALG